MTACAAEPATSMVALTVAPAMAMGAVTICVHPDIKIKFIIIDSINFFMAEL